MVFCLSKEYVWGMCGTEKMYEKFKIPTYKMHKYITPV